MTSLLLPTPDLTGFSDYEAIYKAISEARKEKSKPTIIRLRTTIGYGSKKEGTHDVHGSRKLEQF